MIRKIFLYGQLEEIYGRGPIELDSDTLPLVLAGLNSNLKDFRKNFGKYRDYYLIKTVDGEKKCIGAEEAGMTLGKTEELHFVPSIEGSGFEIAALILGEAFTTLAAASMATIALGVVINIGISFALGALANLLAPSPTASSSGTGRPEDHQSFIFSGPLNVVEQGGPVPLVYGEFRTGSTVISVGVTTEDSATIPNATPGTPPTPPGGGGGGNPGGDGGEGNAVLQYYFTWPYYSMDITSGFHIGDTLKIRFTTGATIKDGANISAAEYGTPALARTAALFTDEACTNYVAGSLSHGTSVMTIFGGPTSSNAVKLQPNTDYYWKMQAWSVDLGDWAGPVGNTDGIRVSINAA